MPYCAELTEPNPDLQAAVSVIMAAGVGFSDDVDNVDVDVISRTCREDGRILTVDLPARAAPVQILEMAFGGDHEVTDPVSGVGEIWQTRVTLDGLYYGVVLVAENKIAKEVSPNEDLGLDLAAGQDYLLHGFYNPYNVVVNSESKLSLPIFGYYEFDLLYMSPIWNVSDSTRRVAFVGDASKYVPFSAQRFTAAHFVSEDDNLVIESLGSVPVAVAYADEGDDGFTFVTLECPFSRTDRVEIRFNVVDLVFYCNSLETGLYPNTGAPEGTEATKGTEGPGTTATDGAAETRAVLAVLIMALFSLIL